MWTSKSAAVACSWASALVCLALLAACRPVERQAEQTPALPPGVLVPSDAKSVQRHEQAGHREVSYVVAAPYPADTFLCELTSFLDRERWRGLREDALNPGAATSLIQGWSEYINAAREPNVQVHAWMSSWLNDSGDLLTYSLQYQYPEDAKPELSTLNVTALLWSADLVRTQLGDRAAQLRTLLLPIESQGSQAAAGSVAGAHCDPPQWSDFVRSTVGQTPAVRGLPSELGPVRTMAIHRDIDGLAGRIAAAIQTRRPDLRVSTRRDRGAGRFDAVLDFNAECRCNEPGAPTGFYVREVLVYRPGGQRAWTEPARVLFYWSDGGVPAWKQVPSECFGQPTVSASCRSAFQNADIAFTEALASAFDSARHVSE